MTATSSSPPATPEHSASRRAGYVVAALVNAVVLLAVVRSDAVSSALTGLITTALSAAS